MPNGLPSTRVFPHIPVVRRLKWRMVPLLVLAVSLQASQSRKLLILGIDGCRPDALLESDAPNLKALAQSGTYTWYALSRPPTKSGPCWSSIFTGVWNDRHGVTDNTFANQRFDQYPMLFRRLNDAYPSFSSGWFVYWPGLNDGMPHAAKVSAGDWSDGNTLDRAKSMLADGDPDALFVQFGAIDAVGHGSGFDPESLEYRAAIERVDGLVGEVLAAMRSRPDASGETWRIIALSDHGGYAQHHGGSTIDEMRTFFIVAGEGVPQKQIAHEWAQRTLPVPLSALALGGDGCVAIPDLPELRFGSGQDFTVELCVNTSGWSGQPALLANKDLRDDRNPGFAFVLIDEGKWRVNAADGTKRRNLSGPVIADGLWHHLAVVFERRGSLRLVQDGILTGSLDITDLGSLDTSLGLCIGQDGRRGLPDFAPVRVSEVRMWKAALTGPVLRGWMFRSATPDHPNWDALAGYWRMDDGEGTRITDAGPAGAHGEVIGNDPRWIRHDAFVEVLDFDSCRTAKTVDLAVTALAHFGVDIRPEWNLDGVNLAPSQIPNAVRDISLAPDSPVLLENYPNPFNAGTQILFSISTGGRTVMKLLDVSGREVATLLDGVMRAGRHRLFLPGDGLTSGVYILRLSGPHLHIIKKILIIK
jgi:hypothetical protein